MATHVIVTAEFKEWFLSLTVDQQDAIGEAVDLLEEYGVNLRGIYTSDIIGSKIALRELRKQYMGRPYRILYVFDPLRQAVLLIGGDKTAKGKSWYALAIRRAEQAYANYLQEINDEE